MDIVELLDGLPVLDQKCSMTSNMYLLLPYLRVPPALSVLTVRVKNGTLCWPSICHGQDAQLCFGKKFASSDFSPYRNLPLVPLPCEKSPPWHTHSKEVILWKQQHSKSSLSRGQNANILLSLELCLQVAWKRCVQKSHPWLWCQGAGRGWPLTGWCWWHLRNLIGTVFED